MIPYTNDRTGLRDYRPPAHGRPPLPVWAPRWPWVLLIVGVACLVGLLLKVVQ